MGLEVHDILISLFRWSCGVAVGGMLGFTFALACYYGRWISQPATTLFAFLRALPILALVPLLLKLVGANEWAKVVLIAWACFFPVFLSVHEAVRQPVRDMEDRLDVNRVDGWRRFLHYDLPRLIQGFDAGMTVSMGIGWLTVVAAEFSNSDNFGWNRGGLGQCVYHCFENANYLCGYTGLVAFGVLGLSSNVLWRIGRHRIARRLGYDIEFR